MQRLPKWQWRSAGVDVEMNSMIDYSLEKLPPVLLIVNQPVKAPVFFLSCVQCDPSIIWRDFSVPTATHVAVHRKNACTGIQQVMCHTPASTINQELTAFPGNFFESGVSLIGAAFFGEAL